MKSPILIAAAILSSAALAALAADPPKDTPKRELTPQQQRMSDCAAASKGMKKEEHDKFMSDCLKKDSTVDLSKPKTTQQQKMTDCNAEAGRQQLKGDARSGFMKECLSGSPRGDKEPAKPEPKPATGKSKDKTKECNTLADKDKLKGDARTKFVNDCMKGAA